MGLERFDELLDVRGRRVALLSLLKRPLDQERARLDLVGRRQSDQHDASGEQRQRGPKRPWHLVTGITKHRESRRGDRKRDGGEPEEGRRHSYRVDDPAGRCFTERLNHRSPPWLRPSWFRSLERCAACAEGHAASVLSPK